MPDEKPRQTTRIVPRSRDERVRRIGWRRAPWTDTYHHLLVLPWLAFLPLAAGLYVVLNAIFALLYLRDPGGITEARPGSFADAFFFSVQTFATIGYGRLSPVSGYTNAVVTAESMLSLLSLALVTGLGFARFSRPTARVRFSRHAVVSVHNGAPTLSVRLANERRNQILEAEASITLVRDECTDEGEYMRRFHDLKLSRSRTPIFAMTFTVMHRIDETSPLHGADAAVLAGQGAEILVSVSGIDETFSQRIHARRSYRAHEVLFGRRFADMFSYGEDGRLAIDFRRFDALQ